MKTFVFLLLLFALLIPDAEAIGDDESERMFTEFVRSYYENDAPAFWKITSQFNEPLFKDQQEVQEWMIERRASSETVLKVKGVIVLGQATIAKEEVGNIEFRFDGLENAPTRIIVITAWVHRVIEFDESVEQDHRLVTEEAVLKIYVSIADEKLVSYRSDEISLDYSFAPAQ
jgi:hypothetical protein